MEKRELINVMVQLVEDRIDEVFKSNDCCKCENCKMDILAIALNDLPTKYVITKAGALYAKYETTSLQYSTDILTAIIKAINIVSNYPRHD